MTSHPSRRTAAPRSPLGYHALLCLLALAPPLAALAGCGTSTPATPSVTDAGGGGPTDLGVDVATAQDTGGATPDAGTVTPDGGNGGGDGGDAGDTFVPYAGPDDWCPGQGHCTGTGDNRFAVGVGHATINPTLVETMWTDLNHNNYYDRGEPFVDTNHNGVFDATWMAGFGTGRPAIAQHDDLEVRAMAFRYNDTLVVWAVLDCVGYFINDMDAIRADPSLAGLGIDKIIIGATHVHEAVDTIGIWGPDAFTTGLNHDYQNLTHTRAAAAIRDAVANLRPARMRVAQVTATDAMGSTMDYVNDTRDPILYDPTVTILRFTEDTPAATPIGQLVNWAAHPEYSGSRNNYLTADYVHYIRDVTEQGVPADHVDGLGGMTLFVQGPLGGQVGPGGGTHPHLPGQMPVTDSGLPKAEAAGRTVGRLALNAVHTTGVDIAPAEMSLRYHTAPLYAIVENVGYHAFYLTGVFGRQLIRFDSSRDIGPGNIPWVATRETVFQIGPVATITAPGELHPELWVGFSDNAHWSWGHSVLNETVNAPDLAQAPAPPYLRDLMLARTGVRWSFVSGLTEDFLGYIVAHFNYVLDPMAPYINEAQGQHYEETNSIGPRVEEQIQHPMLDMARWTPPSH